MFMAPIAPPLPRNSYRIVRLLRRWSAESSNGGPQLPSLVRLGTSIGLAPEATIAIASMFQLTEACLGRPLEGECCCSRRLSPDEQAILAMLAIAPPSHPHQGCPSIPHGLPGALLWAAASVRKLLGTPEIPTAPVPQTCPFGGSQQ